MSTPRAVAGLGVAALLVGAVLLTRSVTAVSDADLAAASTSPPAATEPLPANALDLSAVREVVAADVAGLRLGDTTAGVEAAGYRLGPVLGSCRPVVPSGAWAGPALLPGPGLHAWLVDGVVVSLAVDASAGSDAPLAGLLGRPLTELAALPGAVTQVSVVTVAWSPGRVAVPMVTVPAGGDELLVADVAGDGVVDHAELSRSPGRTCDAALEASGVGGSTLGPGGWGEIRVGMSEPDLAKLVVAVPAEGRGLLRDRETGAVVRSCRTLLVKSPPGPVSVLLGDGEVRSVAIDAGVTTAGLRVGAEAEDVRLAYPDITVAYVRDRWDQGLAVDWQFPDGDLKVFGGPRKAPVPGLDAYVTGPGPVVTRIEIGRQC